MTTEQIDRLIDAISSLEKGNDLWALFAMIVVVALTSGIAAYFGSYLKRKGENLATREDLEGITTTVESIKIDLETKKALKVESIKTGFETKKALRLAALDRRLGAHQEAYTLWRDLVSHSSKETCFEHVSKCQDWWNQNCLYLDAESREAFRVSYLAAHSRPGLLACEQAESIRENFEIVIAAGEKIVAGAALPPLSPKEEAEQIT